MLWTSLGSAELPSAAAVVVAAAGSVAADVGITAEGAADVADGEAGAHAGVLLLHCSNMLCSHCFLCCNVHIHGVSCMEAEKRIGSALHNIHLCTASTKALS